MNEDEEFFAWLDGELDEDAARRVAARVARSPELTARADQHRRLAGGLRKAFEPVMTAPSSPPRFGSAEVVDLGTRARQGDPRAGRRGVPQWAAMAASLAIGLVVGSLYMGSTGTVSPVAIEGGDLIASASLAQALDSTLASAPAGDVRIGLSFRDRSGQVCRSFSSPSASGLACREGKAWELRGLFPAGDSGAGDYRMAAGQNPQLSALIDQAIAGEPFDAGQEKAAMEGDWR